MKKIDRDFRCDKKNTLKNRIRKLREELVDIFIYVLILANLLEMNLEREYFKKRKINERRFSKYVRRMK